MIALVFGLPLALVLLPQLPILLPILIGLG